MGTAYVLNALGGYETRGDETGITLHYAGVPFWLPYKQVVAIPNWTFREVDHDRSTPQSGQIAVLTYQNTIVNGEAIARHFCEGGVPVPGKDMGILAIAGKPTGNTKVVPAGCTADGQIIETEIIEREATKSEIASAEQAADSYKRQVVGDYLQSKRQRMSGGNGKTYPDPMTKAYMDELNMEDVDDVTAHAKNAGLNPELLAMILREVGKSNSEAIAENIVTAVESIRKAGGPQLSRNAKHGRRSLNLAEHKKQVEEAEKAQEEVKA